MAGFEKGKYENYRAYLKFVTEHGEFACDGRPEVSTNPSETGRDELLKRLREVHGEPRFDLYPVKEEEWRGRPVSPKR